MSYLFIFLFIVSPFTDGISDSGYIAYNDSVIVNNELEDYLSLRTENDYDLCLYTEFC
jgi:hypothetical protein